MKLSVVIPVHNEASVVGRTVQAVRTMLALQDDEVIVVDACSSDGCAEEARAAGAFVVTAPAKGRSAQMNAGAKAGSGDVLFFLHADTLPPSDFRGQLLNALDAGNDFGCFRLRFDRAHWSLRAKAWFSRFSASGLHYGDQGLFVRRTAFEAVGGYDARMQVFEDLDLIERLRKRHTFTVLPGPITTSARKYARNSPLRMQLAFYVMFPLYRLGLSQERLVRIYTVLVRQDKL